MRRRELLKSTGLAALPAMASAQTPKTPANNRIGIGVIGCGGQGTADLRAMLRQPDAEIVAACDVYKPNLDRARQLAGGKAAVYTGYRKLLEDKNVQAVIIATPEHWHAVMCIDACDAGKDVYVEKPASHNIRDGRLMVDAARRNKSHRAGRIAATIRISLPQGGPVSPGRKDRRCPLRHLLEPLHWPVAT